MTSPTARTLAELRRNGYVAGVVETWVPVANVRRDFLGIIDVIGVQAGLPVLGVQCTSASNVSARLKKAKALPGLRAWLAAGCLFQVWGWYQREGKWRLRKVALQGEDLLPVDLTPRPRRRRRRERGLFDDVPLPS
jgi:hypothetical protein